MSFGFSWLDQGQNASSQQEQNESITKKDLASANVASKTVISDAKKISSELVGSSEIIKPVLPKGFSKNNNYSHEGIREMAMALQAARSAQNLLESGVVQQANSLSNNFLMGKDPEILRIQKQINQVIKAHEQFKSLNIEQLDALESVVKEVSKQREVINQISEKMKDEQLRKQDSQTILEQEKIRRQNS